MFTETSSFLNMYGKGKRSPNVNFLSFSWFRALVYLYHSVLNTACMSPFLFLTGTRYVDGIRREMSYALGMLTVLRVP